MNVIAKTWKGSGTDECGKTERGLYTSARVTYCAEGGRGKKEEEGKCSKTFNI